VSKVALWDGDSWVYRCGFAAEKTYYLVGHASGSNDENKGWIFQEFDNHKEAKKLAAGDAEGVIDTQMWSRKEVEPLENCLQMVKSSLENTLNVLGTNEYRLYISGRRNFRDDIYPDYKANRDTAGKPKYYRDIRDYLLGQWNGQLCDGIEADDAVGIAAGDLGDRAVVVAVDKDLDQIPGRHYNWTTGEAYTVGPREALRFFYEQLLSGDPTDNVPGITGIGPVKAKKALAECKNPRECADTVLAMYTEAGITLGDLDRNATLLWIQRAKDQKHPFWKHLEMAT
jgi:5'-3' exonuclease